MPVVSRIEQRGIAKGRQEGLRLGETREKKKMLKIAKWMRAAGSDRATIQRLTALSDSELDELLEEHLIVQ